MFNKSSIKNVIVIILYLNVFIIVLLQGYNTKKHLKKLQNSVQLLNKKSIDVTSSLEKLLDQKIISNIHQEISAIIQQNSQIQKSIENIDVTSQALIRNAMAEKVESIVKDKITTEEKVIAIAEWVSSHIANNEPYEKNVYTWFGGRNGLCGVRAFIFVEMLKYINVYSAAYNICEFPTCSNGHSAAQVYYDNKWHFF